MPSDYHTATTTRRSLSLSLERETPSPSPRSQHLDINLYDVMPEVLGSETTRLLGDQTFIVGEHRHRHRGPCAAASVGLDEEVQVASANNNQQSYCRVSFTVVLAVIGFILLPAATIPIQHSIQPNTREASTPLKSSFQHQDMSSDEAQYEPTSTNFHPRYTGPPPDEMTPQQLFLRHSILSTRPHTGLSGPFGPWLSIPAIASPSQELGRVVRYETSLSRRESELVILLTGAKYQSETEFDLHVGEARRAGVGWDVIRSIPRGVVRSSSSNNAVSMVSGNAQKSMSEEKFSFERVRESVIPLLIKEHDDMHLLEEEDGETRVTNNNIKDREVAIVLFAAELLDSNTVSDETYATTRQVLGGDDSILVEITAIVGYYAYVSYTLNVFRIPSSEVA